MIRILGADAVGHCARDARVSQAVVGEKSGIAEIFERARGGERSARGARIEGFREGAAWFDLSTNAVDVVREQGEEEQAIAGRRRLLH